MTDTLAWICKVPGRSGKEKYQDTLKQVEASLPRGKLRKYTREAIK